jgi:hypothetical protein
MREKLKKMSMDWYRPADTYAEVAIALNIAENLPEIPVAEPVTFAGLGNGKRSDAVQASLFDCIHAELLGERDAEKAKVRNRRRNDRKYKLTPKMRKEQKEDRNIAICEKCIKWGWTLVNDAKDAESEQFARKDFDAELEAHTLMIEEYYDAMQWVTHYEDSAESFLDMEFNEYHTPADWIRHYKSELKQADYMREIAMDILKGECY